MSVTTAVTAAPSDPPGPSSEKVQMYSVHMRDTLLPQLEGTRHSLVLVEHDISEYDILAKKLDELEKLDEGIETLTELGAGVWVEARINDTQRVTLDLGLKLHLEMGLSEAREYISQKLGILKKKRDMLSQKEVHLVWQFGQFQGAMSMPTLGGLGDASE